MLPANLNFFIDFLMNIAAISSHVFSPMPKKGVGVQKEMDLARKVQEFIYSKGLIINCPFDESHRQGLKTILPEMISKVRDLTRYYEDLTLESLEKLYWNCFCSSSSNKALSEDEAEYVYELLDRASQDFTPRSISKELYLKNQLDIEKGLQGFYEAPGVYPPEDAIVNELLCKKKRRWSESEKNTLARVYDEVNSQGGSRNRSQSWSAIMNDSSIQKLKRTRLECQQQRRAIEQEQRKEEKAFYQEVLELLKDGDDSL